MIVIAVIIISVGSVYYFMKPVPSAVQPVSDGNIPAVTGDENPPIGASPAKSGETAVSIKGFAFNPRVVTIEKGTSVRWTNDEVVGHDVVGDDASLGLRSPIMPQGDSYIFTFSEAGTFTYYCGVHPSMKGTVIVK